MSAGVEDKAPLNCGSSSSSSSSSTGHGGAAHDPVRADPALWQAQLGLHVFLAVLIGVQLRMTILPQAEIAAEHGAANYAQGTSFLVSFGFCKAVSNFATGAASDRFGRRGAHGAGWLLGLPLGALLLAGGRSGSWSTMLAANAFLGASQALVWSTNIFMLVDVMGPRRRAMANGLSNGVGYIASAASAFGATALQRAYGADGPFAAVLIASALALLLATTLLRETRQLAEAEAKSSSSSSSSSSSGSGGGGGGGAGQAGAAWGARETFVRTTLGEPGHRATLAICLAGMTANLVTGMAWGLVVIWSKRQGLSNGQEATIAACYALPKGAAMLAIGVLSDVCFRRGGRKPIIVGGFGVMAAGLVVTAFAAANAADTDWVFRLCVCGALAVGGGTGIVYPILGASIIDHAPPRVRATALGTYRFWRDAGYAVGALMTAGIEDSAGSFVLTTVAVGVVVVLAAANVQLNYHEGAVLSSSPGYDDEEEDEEEEQGAGGASAHHVELELAAMSATR